MLKEGRPECGTMREWLRHMLLIQGKLKCEPGPPRWTTGPFNTMTSICVSSLTQLTFHGGTIGTEFNISFPNIIPYPIV